MLQMVIYSFLYQLKSNYNVLVLEQATPQGLFELKCYAFVQHCQNFNWAKVDSCEYDIKFLVRNFDIKESRIARKFISDGEYSEIMKVVKSVRK